MTNFIEMAKRHRDADMLAKGSFRMIGGKACSIGCFNAELGNGPKDFAAMARDTGYPEAAHHLQEDIFEGLPFGGREDWHVQFFEKAATVKNWTRVLSVTMLASLRIAKPHDTSDENVVDQVISMYERRLRGDEPTGYEWDAARDAAWAAVAADAVARAADAAAWAAAAWAAAAAAWAARAAADAADDAARAARAARAAARAAAWAARAAADATDDAADAARAAAGAAYQTIRDAFLEAE